MLGDSLVSSLIYFVDPDPTILKLHRNSYLMALSLLVRACSNFSVCCDGFSIFIYIKAERLAFILNFRR